MHCVSTDRCGVCVPGPAYRGRRTLRIAAGASVPFAGLWTKGAVGTAAGRTLRGFMPERRDFVAQIRALRGLMPERHCRRPKPCPSWICGRKALLGPPQGVPFACLCPKGAIPPIETVHFVGLWSKGTANHTTCRALRGFMPERRCRRPQPRRPQVATCPFPAACIAWNTLCPDLSAWKGGHSSPPPCSSPRPLQRRWRSWRQSGSSEHRACRSA